MRRRFEGMTLSRPVYWEVEQRGNTVVTTSGSIGDSAPKVHVKQLANSLRAREEQDRLITVISKQGYEEVSALQSNKQGEEPQENKHKSHWTKVMCLTGVDYFSTLGYQPSIAFLAAGILSPIATLIVTLVTLFGLVPLYSRVAKESPFGQGSISMLERLLPGWRGKALVLVLLGFAATDFVITMTLSAADATAHAIANPMFPQVLANPVAVTTLLLAGLAVMFINGFREAIGLSVVIVVIYLTCNAVILGRCVQEVTAHPLLLTNWHHNLFSMHHNATQMILAAVLLFPKLALGMSGFETGVAVMPLIADTDRKRSAGDNVTRRVSNTRKLLASSAVIMSVLLMVSSVVTTVLIPAEAFAEGGAANGRALAYLAHKYLGEQFGTLYDLSTISILWFAGASALAGLLALVPKYLPKYGMAPDWAQNQKAMVAFFFVLSTLVTFLFKANVDAQAGAYATGVLVLMSSAALAVVLAIKREFVIQRFYFCMILAVMLYTTVANIMQRPEGLQISLLFIGFIIAGSLLSRVMRSLELRIKAVTLDEGARALISQSLSKYGRIFLVAHRKNSSTYSAKEAEIRHVHRLTDDEAGFIFLEIELSDPSEFMDDNLEVTSHLVNGYHVLRCQSPAIPNAIAALSLHLRDLTKVVPSVYFSWTEGNPILYMCKYIFLGEGETAFLTREILRETDRDPQRRPRVVVG